MITDATTNEQLQVFTGRMHFLNVHLAFPFIYKLDHPGQEWEYTSVAQGYFHQRALHGRDYYAAALISTNCNKKNLAKVKVQNLNETAWHAYEEENHILLNLLRASYTQTLFIRRRLLQTKGTRLVYALSLKTPELYWSCGVKYGDRVNVANSATWPGRNRLGVLLEQVRDELTV